MAEEKEKKGNNFNEAWLVLGLLLVLVFFWFYTGAYKKAHLNGIFLQPPAPLGPGNSYGPQVGQPTQQYNDAQAAQQR